MTLTLAICNIFNTIIIFDFLNSIYIPKYNNKYVYPIAIIIFYTIHISINLQHIAVLNLITEILIIQFTAKLLYLPTSRQKTYNFLFSLYLIFIDWMSFAIISRLLSIISLSNISDTQQFTLCICLQYIILITTYRFGIKLFHQSQKDKLPTYQNLFFPLLAFFEILICFYVWNMQTQTSNNILILMCISFIALDVYLVYLFFVVHKQTQLQNDLKLARQQSFLLDTNIRNIERQYCESRKIIHDVRGHLNALDQLYTHGQNDSANNLKRQLEEQLNRLDIGFFTRCPLLNIVLYDRLCIAKEKQIKTNFIIQHSIDLNFMEEIDITTLFTNLLNNAIEASESVPHNRFIELKIGQINNSIVVSCRNAYLPQNLKLVNGQYQSTKPNHFGIGINNLKQVIAKYNGVGEWKATSEYFTVEFFLAIPNKKEQ